MNDALCTTGRHKRPGTVYIYPRVVNYLSYQQVHSWIICYFEYNFTVLTCCPLTNQVRLAAG